MTQIPTDLRYTAQHEWVREGDPATIGITAAAAEALGDIVYVELPQPGAALTAGAVCGEIESTKSVSELYSPVTGTVVAANIEAIADPSLINVDPFGRGWLLKVTVEATGVLLSPDEYQDLAAE